MVSTRSGIYNPEKWRGTGSKNQQNGLKESSDKHPFPRSWIKRVSYDHFHFVEFEFAILRKIKYVLRSKSKSSKVHQKEIKFGEKS